MGKRKGRFAIEGIVGMVTLIFGEIVDEGVTKEDELRSEGEVELTLRKRGFSKFRFKGGTSEGMETAEEVVGREVTEENVEEGATTEAGGITVGAGAL